MSPAPGVLHRRDPFISQEHSKADLAHVNSPGPAYNPNMAETQSAAPHAAFTVADRAKANIQYIAAAFAEENFAATTPGPGTYRLKYGKGIAKTFGDAPTHKFGSGPGPGRVTAYASSSSAAPGPGAHDVTRGLGAMKEKGYTSRTAPAYTFAPLGSTSEGALRDRAGDAKPQFISQEHRRVEPNMTIGVEDMPSSNSYVLESPFGHPDRLHSIDAVTRNKREPAFTFGTAPRDQQDKMCVAWPPIGS